MLICISYLKALPVMDSYTLRQLNTNRRIEEAPQEILITITPGPFYDCIQSLHTHVWLVR